MIRRFFVRLGLVAAAVGLMASSATASPFHVKTIQLLKLKRGESYSRARATLLRQGWTPFKSKGDHGTAEDVLGAGWTEVLFCYGTGRAFCTFIWKRNGRCALITTAGEYYPEYGAPKVWDAETGGCASILRRA